MKVPPARVWVILAPLAVIGFAGWWYGWFVREPVYHGRTVTTWLDRMETFAGERNDRSGNGYSVNTLRLADDLKPFVALGSKAVPVLVERLTEAPQWQLTVGPTEHLTAWAHWEWNKLSGSKPGPFPPVVTYPGSFQSARQNSAALALLALGTNAQAGLPRLLEALIASPRDFGGNRSFTPYVSLSVAKSLPDRRAEIIFGINSALQDTNSEIKGLMATATRLFPNQLPLWKNRLLELTGDHDESVRIWALMALAITASSDTNIVNLLDAIIRDPSRSVRERGYAAGDLGICGINATNSLPQLREASKGTNSFFTSSAAAAIQMIEKAMRDDKTTPAK